MDYSETRREEFLEKLIIEISPIINIILSKYHKFDRHADDMSQEIKLRLWKNIRERSNENLKRYYRSPTSYLYFLIREYAVRSFRRLSYIYQEDVEIAPLSIMEE